MTPAAKQPQEARPNGKRAETKTFLPVPERMSQYLELKTAEVATQMQSKQGREALFTKLLEHEADLRQTYPTFNPDVVRSQLDDIGETLAAKEKYLAEMQPKKGIFRRALEGTGRFIKNHKLATLFIVLAAVAGGIGLAAYSAGGIEALFAKVGLSHLYTGAQSAKVAAEELGKKIIEGGSSVFPETFDGSTGGIQP